MLFPADDAEAHAGCETHGPFEGASCGPLRGSVVADEAKGDGGEDAVCCAYDKHAVGSEDAVEEGSVFRAEEEGHVAEGEEGAEVEG